MESSKFLNLELSNSSTLHVELFNSSILHVKLSYSSALYVKLFNSFHHLANILSHVIRRFIHSSNIHPLVIQDILQSWVENVKISHIL